MTIPQDLLSTDVIQNTVPGTLQLTLVCVQVINKMFKTKVYFLYKQGHKKENYKLRTNLNLSVFSNITITTL